MARISEDVREQAFERSGGKCWFCGASPATDIEHLTPKDREGDDSFRNLVGACDPCNSKKAGHRQRNQNWNLEEFRIEIARRRNMPASELKFYGEQLLALRKELANQLNDKPRASVLRGNYDKYLEHLPDAVEVPDAPDGSAPLRPGTFIDHLSDEEE